MTDSDEKLGLNHLIKRRDFVAGMSAVAASSFLPDVTARDAGFINPPKLTGLRGGHPGAIEVAHQLGRFGRTDWSPIRTDNSITYDLVVVGAGLSGLAAAFFYRQENPTAKILILDNHDDFGGHAKRNEFWLKDRLVLSHGGSQTLQEPSGYSEESLGLLRDLGVNLGELKEAFDQTFFQRHGLTDSTYFDKATFGVDQIVRFALASYSNFLPLHPSPLDAIEAVKQMPLGDQAKSELLLLLQLDTDRLKGIPLEEQKNYLWDISYREFLVKHLGIRSQELMKIFQGLTCDTGASIEWSSALELMGYGGFPGLSATGISDFQTLSEPYLHHFPDGNASITRMLVQRLIPSVSSATSMADTLTADFDYSKLDLPEADVRLRLNSTVVGVQHDGSVSKAKQVAVEYVKGGQTILVRGNHCILAGYNSMIRFMCSELPEEQKAAQSRSVKTPILYTNVLLRNWRAWQELGIGCASCPGSYYSVAFLDFPVSMGVYRHAQSPDEPIIVHMERFPKGTDHDVEVETQLRAGRQELYTTSLKQIERETRAQLTGMLSEGGFDPGRDIAAITANRWGHGYARYASSDWETENWSHVIGREKFGRIAIANSDAGGVASVDCAIEQAARAVNDLA